MLFRVPYTLDRNSSGVRWAPLVGYEIRDHRPRTDRVGDLIVDAATEDALIARMGTYNDVIAFGVRPLSEDA